jgi:membrane protein
VDNGPSPPPRQTAEERPEVVLHEPGERAGSRDRHDYAAALVDEVDIPVGRDRVQLPNLGARPQRLRVGEHRIPDARDLTRLLVRQVRGDRLPPALEDDGRANLVRDLKQLVDRMVRVHRREDTAAMRQPLFKFFADRGPHLAAMIAYFALLSLVPLIFLALALLGLFGRADESTYLVTELKNVLPSASISQIVGVVNEIQDNAATLGLIGGVFLLWTSLSLFSVLESAFNIVYGRPNRSFLHGKGIAVIVMLGSLVTLFVGLVIGTIGFAVLEDAAPGLITNRLVGYVLSLVVSTAAVFAFLVSIYYLLPNEKLAFRDVLPGAVLGSILLQVSFQALPLYVALSQREEVLTLRALGAPVILLIWLYVMANAIVFGAEVNWWLARGRYEDRDAIPGLA